MSDMFSQNMEEDIKIDDVVIDNADVSNYCIV